MGFDVKEAADRVIATIDALPAPSAADVTARAEAAMRDVSGAIAANPGSFLSYMLAAIALMSMVSLLWRARERLMKAIEGALFTNWQLGLLGTTGIVLSLASGYTTWDGMRNFTGEPILSGMVTFGIQGVMLIAAWLIGESFAVGMNQQRVRVAGARGSFGLDPGIAKALGAVIGIALFVTAMTLLLQPATTDGRSGVSTPIAWSKLGDNLLMVVSGLLLIAFIALNATSDMVKPYLQSGRIIIRNMVIWVMFLACMATSVFFSFDSLFSSIFPQSERARAAELRAQNQVAGILSDIEQRIVGSRLEEAQAMFATPGFQTYDAQLDRLTEASRAAAPEIERYFNDQIEERNRAVKQQQERMTTAQSGQAGLALKKQSLADELLRLKSDRPGLAADFGQKQADVTQRQREIDTKRVEAMAEAGGVEGTGKEGKGPIYRQRMEELGKLQAALKIAEERQSDARKRLTAVESRITQIEREQSALDGDLAKLKGEQETAEQRIKLTQEQLPSDAGARVDPSRVTPAFESARAEFRQEPTQDRLLKVQQLCTQIYAAMATASPATKKAVAGIDCDPKQAAEAASVVFALNAGSEAFGRTCKGGDKLAPLTSTDALFGFARKCLVDSGLTSKETEQLRTKINFIELNRDDKAHRFVVTLNAFNDGNRLAYLALSIAIAIDSLIFMSGLFGANALRSPLSDVPSPRARSAQQLEATINAALGKAPYDTAHLVLSELRPITNTDGFSSVITLDGLDKVSADRIRLVLTAGADIRAVEAISASPERYRVRSELREYLSSVVDRHLKTDKTVHHKARVEQVAAAALRPHVQEHADIVIGHLHPMKPVDGFTSTVSLAALAASNQLPDLYDARVVRRVMNAGATVEMVAPDKTEDGRFYVRPDFYEALLMLSARSPKSRDFETDRQRFYVELLERRQVAEGGALRAVAPRLDAEPRPIGLQAPTPRPNEGRSDPADGRRGGARPAANDWDAYLGGAGSPASDRGDGRADDEGADERHQEFLSGLVAALGLDSRLFQAASGPIFGAAVAASDEFARARRQNRNLDNALIECDEEARIRIERTYDLIERRLATTDERSRQTLKNAYQDIEQNWAILMLLPGGPYERMLTRVVEALEPEAAAGNLSDAHLGLLASARQLRVALQSSPRDSESAWVQLGRQLAMPAGARGKNGGTSMV